MERLFFSTIAILIAFINTVSLTIPLILTALLKFFFPVKAWRNFIDKILNFIGELWISINNLNMQITTRIKWEIKGVTNLKKDSQYLVLANHQSWVDILVLQKVFNKKIPLLKFFIKKNLIYVPFLGLCWWALDFPFMKRYSRKFLEKKPHLKGKDIETTKKFCEKFKGRPVSIMNFLEGTRFTQKKHSDQKSPYTNLLKPKAGGFSFVIESMGENLKKVLDVTIFYPDSNVSIWNLLTGKMQKIIVQVREFELDSQSLIQNRDKVYEYINSLWKDKDNLLSDLRLEESKTV